MPMEDQKAIKSPGTSIMYGCEPPYDARRALVFLTTEQSLQILFWLF